MKKRINYLIPIILVLAQSAISFAQNAPIDFETGGNGANWTWTTFENDANPAVEIVSNPSVSGINTSATVAKFTALQTGQPWAGCESLHGADIGTFTLDATNSTVKIMVYKTVVSDVGIKFAKNDGWSLGEIKVANTAVNEWEELTFDFSAQVQEGYDQIVIFPDFDLNGRSADNICYFDNITFSAKSTSSSEPTVAAPTPTHQAEDVFSIYSDAYTNLENTNLNPNWGQSTIVTYETIESNNTLKYSALNYQGTNLGSADGGVPQDVSEYDYLHVDFWTPNATALNFFIIDQSEGEVSYPLPITTEEWVSVDIPLSHFSGGGENLADIHQFKVDGGDGASTEVWFDNWYFFKGGSVVVSEPAEPAPTPTYPAENVFSIYSDAYTNLENTNLNPNWGQSTTVTYETIESNNTLKYSALNYQGTNLGSADGGVPQDVSGYDYLHVDFWTPNATSLNFFIIDQTAGEVSYPLPITTEEWVSVDIPLSHFSGGGENLADIHQFKVDGGDGVATVVWFDNLYFYKEGTAIREIEGSLPSEFALQQNYPNPFNPSTSIKFSLPKANHVTIKVYNMLGQEMATLLNEFTAAGTFDVTFDGAEFPSGVYLYSISAGNFVAIKKMILIK